MTDFTGMKLGRKALRVDKRTLQLGDYLTPALKPPARVDWESKLSGLGVMMNDRLGCCTIAAKGHLIQAWTANHGQQVIVPDSAILAGYEQACGYVPGDDSTDQGGNMLDVLNWFRKTGLAGHKPFAFVAVNHNDKKHVELAVDLFGGCDIGIELPISAQRQEVWSVPHGGAVGDGERGSWGGHDVPIVGYSSVGPVCITWGRLLTMTWSFFKTYVDEAYAVLAPDWADGKVQAPNGFDLTQLQADLAAVTG